MAQLSVVAVAPAEDLALGRDCQRVPVRALRRRNFPHAAWRVQRQLLGHGLVVRVAQSESPIAALPTGPDRTVGRDRERAVLARLDLRTWEVKLLIRDL